MQHVSPSVHFTQHLCPLENTSHVQFLKRNSTVSPWFLMFFHSLSPRVQRERVGEALSGIQGDRCSRVTAAAGRRLSGTVFMPFYMCSNQGDHN